MKKFIMGTIFGIILCLITYVIADTIHSDEVLYDNSYSSSNTDNVQDALDGLYNIVDRVGSGFSLIANNTSGLSTELIGGLYRYQGVQDANNNVDNYICFATTDKNTCLSDTSKYMYRIIGVNTSGQIKLLKKEALPETYIWNNEYGADWPSSSLFAGLNGSYFLTNTTYVPDNTWSSRIADANWYYITTTSNNTSTIAERENDSSNPYVLAKVGLMSISDYASTLVTPDYSSSSWAFLLNNDSSYPKNVEWTMTRYNTKNGWRIISNGTINSLDSIYDNMKRDYSVRPSFFLRSSETIASGSGTITDPYVLN